MRSKSYHLNRALIIGFYLLFEIPALASDDRWSITSFFTVVALVLLFISELGKKSIIVSGNNITIKTFLKAPVEKQLTQITNINWGSPVGQRQIWMRSVNYSQRIRNDYFTVSFADGFLLEVNVKEYSNFDELRGWFLTYGRKAGIIKVRPLEERKRSRRK